MPGVTMKPAIVIHPGAEWLELSWWSRVKHDDDEASHDDAAGETDNNVTENHWGETTRVDRSFRLRGYTDGFPGGGGHQQGVEV